MYCINCGTQLPDGAKFCSACGAAQPDLAQAQPIQQPVQQTQAQPQYQQPDFQQPYHSYTPEPPKKSKKPLIITVIIIAVVAVLAVAAVLLVPTMLNSRHSLEAAEKYLQQNNFDAAVAEYEALIDKDPDNTDAYIGLAETYAEMAKSGKADIDDMMDEIEDLMKDVDDDDAAEEIAEILDELAEKYKEEEDTDKEEITSRPAETTKEDPVSSAPAETEKLELSDINGVWGTTGYTVSGSEFSDPMNLYVYDRYISIETMTDSITIYTEEMEFSEDSFVFYYNNYKFTYTYNEYSNAFEAKRESAAGATAYMYYSYGAVELVEPEGKVLNIWCWNDEFRQRVTQFYPGYIDNGDSTGRIGDVTVKWTINAAVDNGYQIPLDVALIDQNNVTADEKIDIFLIEPDYADKYVNSSYTLDLGSIGITDADIAEMYPYTKEIATDKYGALKGASWQATPGVFAYRRSIAREVLGTDDPAEVQKYLADWDKFDETAAKMKSAGYYMLSGYDEAYRTFSQNVSAPWVNEDGQIIIDENILRWIEQTKTYTDSEYFNPAHSNNSWSGRWSEIWFEDHLPDSKVFGFFYSTWGVNFTLPMNAGDEGYGDWAICEGPDSYFWGGTWICAAYQTDNKSLVTDIIYQMCCNEEVAYAMATDPNTLDYANNMAAMERAANSDYSDGFLGGQNSFEIFHEAATKVDMSNISPYDLLLNETLQYAFADYFNGLNDYDTALQCFYNNVVIKYPELWYEN